MNILYGEDFRNIKDPYGWSYIHCFFNSKSDCLFTSYKVCSRSLCELAKIKKNVHQIYEIKSSYNLHAFVRCPYTRIESLYKDKLILFTGPYSNLQSCQIEIIKVFGERRLYNRNITFEEFVIDGLPLLFLTESHFLPQVSYIPAECKHILHIENKDDLKYGFSLFNCDIVHKHKTYNWKFAWTDEMKRIVNMLYTEDFTRFNYTK